MKDRMPDFIVVGAVKSGTTSLFHLLKQHPAIFVPGAKEINYFSRGRSAAQPHSLDDYRAFFRGARSNQLVGEVSTGYLYAPRAAERIAEVVGPDVMIIILLRNPVDMIYSLWGQNVRDGGEPLPFESALAAEAQRMADPAFGRELSGWIGNYAYRDRARYTPQVARYLDVFGRPQVSVHLFEEFFLDTTASMRQLFAFLGMDPDFNVQDAGRYNEQGEVRSTMLHKLYFENSIFAELLRPLIPARTRRALTMWLYRLNTRPRPRQPLTHHQCTRLMQLFEPDIRELGVLLNRNLAEIWACDGEDSNA